MAIVTCLATLNISKYIEEDGKEVEPEVKVTDGLIAYVRFAHRVSNEPRLTVFGFDFD